MAQEANENTMQQWLSTNGLATLLPVLIEEEIECIDDLLIFERSEIRERLLGKGTMKLGKIAKLMRALDKYENDQQNVKEEKDNDEVDDNDDSNVKHYEYEHDYDANGILYAMGTDFGATDYKNPLAKVKFSWQNLMSNGGHDSAFVGRDDLGATVKTNKLDVWYAIDFGQYHIKPTRFTLRSCYDFGRHRELNWEFQASHDAKEWICLKEHPKIKLMKGKDTDGYSSIHTWQVAANKYYQHFRIYIKNWKQHKPPNWDNNDEYIYLNISGLELYGAVKISDTN